MCPPDLPTNFSAEPCMKAGLDLSAKYLVLSDIKRQVIFKRLLCNITVFTLATHQFNSSIFGTVVILNKVLSLVLFFSC